MFKKVSEGIGAFIPQPMTTKETSIKKKNRRTFIHLLWVIY